MLRQNENMARRGRQNLYFLGRPLRIFNNKIIIPEGISKKNRRCAAFYLHLLIYAYLKAYWLNQDDLSDPMFYESIWNFPTIRTWRSCVNIIEINKFNMIRENFFINDLEE